MEAIQKSRGQHYVYPHGSYYHPLKSVSITTALETINNNYIFCRVAKNHLALHQGKSGCTKAQ